MELFTATREKIQFLGIFFAVFFITAVLLFVIDFVPEAPARAGAAVENNERASIPLLVEEPRRIVIASVGVDTPVSNPASFDLPALDAALLAGAVRYPGSNLLGEEGAVFLFGHQSYLPVVKNKAFKAFNDLQKLSEGAVIKIFSDTAVYEYVVRSVSLVEAEEALIDLSAESGALVLSTCNSFGDPGERYVVTADLVRRTVI